MSLFKLEPSGIDKVEDVERFAKQALDFAKLADKLLTEAQQFAKEGDVRRVCVYIYRCFFFF